MGYAVKKPIKVEYWNTGEQDILPGWAIEPYNNKMLEFIIDDETGEAVEFVIQTLEGAMQGVIGDYIIKGVEGELYPVRKDIFEKTYEVVE